MFTTYLITYDLRKPGRNYSSLYEAIKSYKYWIYVIDSVWMVYTTHSAIEIRDTLKPYLDQSDSLLVIKANPPHWATIGIDKRVTEWLNSVP